MSLDCRDGCDECGCECHGPRLDAARLLDWLDHQPGGVVIQAVYQTLAKRIRRGDFDAREEVGDGDA